MSIEKFLEEKVSKIKISLLIYLFSHYLYTAQKIHQVQKIPMQ